MDEANRMRKDDTSEERHAGLSLPPQFGKRCIVLIIGLAFVALGVAFAIKSDLGTSPVSSLPYVVSLITPLTVGNVTILLHCVFILLQILILRKRYQPLQLLQLPVAILFGYLTDFFVWLTQGLSYNSYWQQWIYCAIGILLVGFGVTVEVLSKALSLAAEGLVLAICQVAPVKFGNMKVALDVSLVVLACVISIVFTGTLSGVREGTVAAAILVGICSKQMMKPVSGVIEKLLGTC